MIMNMEKIFILKEYFISKVLTTNFSHASYGNLKKIISF